MRKWFLFLVILGLIYILSKASRKKETRSPFHKRFNETVSIVVWVMLIAYVVSFLYWLYTQIFK
jgi:magnesium-transporting ATPase (P-type)